jgi:hypothetical protein
MTAYPGTKSHDAEITLDFINKNVIMDYSLNKYGSMLESSTSAVIKDSLKTTSFLWYLKDFIIFIFQVIVCLIPTMVIGLLMTILLEYKIITNSKVHYLYQRLLKYTFSGVMGITKQSHSGELLEPKLVFHIPRNLWFEYNLSYDYKDYIKSVSLKRCFRIYYMFGKYPRQQQFGWDVILEFTNIPKNGSCELKYI